MKKKNNSLPFTSFPYYRNNNIAVLSVLDFIWLSSKNLCFRKSCPLLGSNCVSELQILQINPFLDTSSPPCLYSSKWSQWEKESLWKPIVHYSLFYIYFFAHLATHILQNSHPPGLLIWEQWKLGRTICKKVISLSIRNKMAWWDPIFWTRHIRNLSNSY